MAEIVMVKTALVLGVDNQDGAYLARLLVARGYRVAGTGADAGRLERLGIAAEVALVDPDARAEEIYDLRGPGPARVAGTAALIGGLRGARLFSAGPGAAADAAAGLVAAAREGEAFAVTGRMFERESRLGGKSFVARIVGAAYAATEPAPADLGASTDCGWAPEYVDAMWRMLQRVNPADFVLATGRLLSGVEVARHAFAYFGHDVTPFGGDGGAGTAGDPGPARADLGWSATTWGRDLVRTLCEGLAEQKGAWT